MEPNKSKQKNSHAGQNTFDQHIIVWIGDFDIVPQENGYVFLDIAFIDHYKSLEI